MNATMRKQVGKAIQAWAKSYCGMEVDAVMAHFVPGSRTMSFGTGADEVVRGTRAMRRQLTRDFRQADAVGMSVRVRTVTGSGAVAWFAGDCTMRARVGREKIVMPGRITGVLVRQGRAWLIDQIHYAMPMTTQAAGQSWAK